MILVFVIAGFNQGGAQRQCAELINRFSQVPGYDVHLIYGYEGPHFNEVNRSTITMHKYIAKSIYSVSVLRQLNSIINSINPDVVYSWLHASDVHIGILKVISNVNFKWIMAERDSHYPFNWRYQLRFFLALLTDVVIANSKSGQKYWAKNFLFRNKEVMVIPNILIVPDDKGLVNFGDKLVLYAGRYEKQKNVSVIYRAFKSLSEKYTDYNFMMVGSGTLYEEFLNGERMTNFHILTHSSDIYSIYKKARVFVNVSSHEGTPNTVIENMHYGNTLVLSNIPEHLALVGDDYPFLVNDFNNEVAVENQIVRAMEYNGEINSYYSVLSEFNAAKILQQHRQIFEGILK
ncbi:glycosyltransferase [Shewanella vesiculosa]|uniref:glycosyltransferase n=1 Tax=Shewanella vesiculosa TaxID=518738 RepID=UPI00384B6B2E